MFVFFLLGKLVLSGLDGWLGVYKPFLRKVNFNFDSKDQPKPHLAPCLCLIRVGFGFAAETATPETVACQVQVRKAASTEEVAISP